MSQGLRFTTADDNHRPFGCHRFVVWSPKIQRRLTLFGEAALNAWISIEANAHIAAFCERPVVSRSQKPARVVDFWVHMPGAEELWFLRRSREPQDDPGASIAPSFRSWAQDHGLTLRYYEPTTLELSEPLAHNWGVVLRYLAANRSLVNRRFLDEIRSACTAPVALIALEQKFAAEDPVVVRAAAFTLLQQGILRAPEFASTPIGPAIRFQAAG